MEWLWGICVFMADDGLGCGLAGLEPEETDVHVPCCLSLSRLAIIILEDARCDVAR